MVRHRSSPSTGSARRRPAAADSVRTRTRYPAATPTMSWTAEIGVHELRAMLDAGEPVCLLDVRQPWEFEIGHLAGSLLMPLPELAHRTDEIEAPVGALVVT